MKRRLSVIVVLCCAMLTGTPSAASAQIIDFMEWLERLSGPRLRAGEIDILLRCEYPNTDRATGITVKSFFDCIPSGANVTEPGTGRQVFRASEPSTAEFFKYQRRVMYGVRIWWGGSGEDFGPYRGKNGLPYAPSVTGEQKDVNVFAFGPTVTLPLMRSNERLRGVFDLGWAFEVNRFSGPLVDDFWIPSVDVFNLTAKPLRKVPWLDAFEVRVRLKQFLGSFDSSDFGSEPGFSEKNDRVYSVALLLDATKWIQRRKFNQQEAAKLPRVP